jgi:epoxyqueuosine reductase
MRATPKQRAEALSHRLPRLQMGNRAVLQGDFATMHDNPYRRTRWQRIVQMGGHKIAQRAAMPLWRIVGGAKIGRLARLPHIPTNHVGRLRSPAAPWTTPVPAPPAELRTVAGIRRDPVLERQAHERAPLYLFFHLHADLIGLNKALFSTLVAAAPRLMTATRKLLLRQNCEPTTTPRAVDPQELTLALKRQAASLGISAAGVAHYDPKYTFAEFVGNAVGDRVVVCALEQNYDATQRIPSFTSEQAALATYGQLEDKILELAEWLRAQGYRARPEPFEGESLVIHYGVAGGLGQLGLNGQLLTPHAGSRCRLNMLTTNAPLELDEPVDFGIEGVCDRCQICVRRCPVGAIPNHRSEHRGVVKAKLNTKRCLPLMVKTEGCSICMKVCPIQRYGLPAVLDEYDRSGQILGKDTDDLEGYDWILDGRHYGPGHKPRVPETVVKPEGFDFDPTRTEPPEPFNGVFPTLMPELPRHPDREAGDGLRRQARLSTSTPRHEISKENEESH